MYQTRNIPVSFVISVVLVLTALNIHSQGMTKTDSLTLLISQTKDKTKLASYYLELSILTFSKDPKESAAWAQKALELPQKKLDNKQIADAYAYYGRAMSSLNVNDSALTMYSLALDIYKQEENLFLQARMHNAIGSLYLKQGVYHSALDAFYKALRLMEEIGSENYERAISTLLNNIGNIHYFQENFDQALENYLKAYNLIEFHGDSLTIANTYNNLGVAYEAKNEFGKALEFYELALPMYKKINHVEMQCNTLYNMGIIAIKQKKFSKAARLYQQCLEIGRKEKNVFGLLSAYIGLVNVESKLRNESNAVTFADSALTLIDKSNRYDRKLDIYRNLFEMYKAKSDYEEALKYHMLFTEVNDSIFSIENNRQIEELNARFETDKKEQEIRLLQIDKQQAQTRNNLLIIIYILTFLLAVFIIYSFAMRHRKSLAMLEKEKEIDRFKSTFFANISHEFRTPLTLIQGPVQKMLESENNLKKKQNLKLIQRSTVQLLRMVNQILDLAKIDAGKLELHATRMDIVKPLQRWVMSYHSLAETKNVQLNITISHEIIESHFDISALETIVNNLLSNALKYETKGGQVDVVVNVEIDKVSNQKKFKLEIKNYHSFIPASEIDKIFDRYHRVDKPEDLQDNIQGTGIGLALVKELTDLHNGTINASSSQSEGTLFSFEMPLSGDATVVKEGAPDKQASSEHLQSISESIDSALLKENANTESDLILVIEDNSDVREFVSNSLKEAGYLVIQADDGKKGVETALKAIPDLIVSDVMMPEKDGYAVCNELKNDEKTNHIPIILLTAKASFESKLKGLETMADDYLVKPFNTSELLTRVNNLITLRKKLREKFSGLLPSSSKSSNPSLDETFLQKVRKAINENLSDEKFSVELLSSAIGLSRSQLHRKLSAISGMNPNQFIRNYRLEKAMEMLRHNAATAAEIAYEVGFSSPAYFGKCFKEYFHLSPGEVRNTVKD